MSLLKLKRNLKFIKEYEGSKRGTVIKDVVSVKLTILGLPLKTVSRYKKEYNGEFVKITKNYEIIESKRPNIVQEDYKIRLIKSKLKHAQTRDYIITVLKQIDKKSESYEVCRIVDRAVEELKENSQYKVYNV